MHCEQRLTPKTTLRVIVDSTTTIADDYEDDMMMDEDELIAPSPTAEDIFEEDGRFAGPRVPNVKVVDKNFFNGKVTLLHATAFCSVHQKRFFVGQIDN